MLRFVKHGKALFLISGTTIWSLDGLDKFIFVCICTKHVCIHKSLAYVIEQLLIVKGQVTRFHYLRVMIHLPNVFFSA